MTSLFAEVRQACRSLGAQPAWTVAALLCLAIGTGANTAAFSLINGVLLRALPFDEPDQIVMIAIRQAADRKAGPVSLAQFRDLSTQSGLFQNLAVRTYFPVGVGSDGPARMAQAEFVSGEYFALLRLRPAAGRLFGKEADRIGTHPEAVLSEKIWRTRFNRDPGILGRTIRVNGKPVVVIGIAPAGFVGAMRLIAADMWLPASTWPSFVPAQSLQEAETRREFGLVGRLMPGTSLAQTRERFAIFVDNQTRHQRGSDTAPAVLMEEATGFGVPPGVRSIVIAGSALLFGLMALLVAVAIANVACLMLARATGREKEIAVRLALGASRYRIVRQVLTESVILALAGAAIGAALAAALPSLMTSLSPALPEHLSFAIDTRPDWRTGIYAVISAIAIAMFFGLAPARHAATTDSNLALRESAGNSRARSTTRSLSAFVVGQVAVSTVLLVITVLLSRTYLNTLAVDPGIDIRNTLAVSIDLGQTALDNSKGRDFFGQLLTRAVSMPGVQGAALTRQTPLSPQAATFKVWGDSSTSFNAGAAVVTDGYFDVVRLPILRGRSFSRLDTGSVPVAIVNETMARQLSPAADVVGQTFSLGTTSGRRLEVIGVTRDAKHRSLAELPVPVFYEPFSQTYSAQMTLLLRSNADVRQLADPIRRELLSQNPDLAAITVRTLEDQFQESAAPSRQRAVILMGVCGIALALSAFGLFGVMAYGVRQQVRELGIRIAIGATPANIAMMVLRQALRLTGIGLVLGLALAFAATRVIASVLFGVSAHDPATIGVVVALLAAVAAAAAYLPARWAMQVDPVLSMRAE